MKNNWRQKLHLEPESGWLNDPNGLSFFGGYYQVYFQYSPESAVGEGDKCWGHWRSKDLIHWEYTGIVLRPDIPEDRSGVYSGSGLVKDDELYLFYTGNVKEEGDHDYIMSGRGANVILVTTKDGHHVNKKQVLLRNSDYPENMTCHVRDPKVWAENGYYRMVLGARKQGDEGCVLYYRSEDLTDWSFEKEESIPDFGYMWECPDVITFGNEHYLSISPQGLQHEEYRNQNVYSSGYFDSNGSFEEWDYGFDFYAPQSFEAPDGRRILIGWMGIGDIPYHNPTVELGWQHCLTLPRVVTRASNGRLLQKPVSELEKLRKMKGKLLDRNSQQINLPFEMIGIPDGDFRITFEGIMDLSWESGVFSLRFTDTKISGGRNVRRVRLENCKEIRLIADTSSVEIYLNGGEKVMSSRFYPENTEVTIFAENLSGVWYELGSIQVIS